MAQSKSAEILTPLFNAVRRVWLHPRVITFLWVVWAVTRWGHLLAIRGTAISNILIVDSLHYHEFAKQFAEHGWGNHTWFMNPGYPTFVGILYWLVTVSPLLVMFVQTLLEALALVLTMAVGRRLLPETTVRLAFLFWVCYSPFPYYDGTILTTTLIVTLTVAALYFLFDLGKPIPWWKLSLGGLFIGLAILCRPIPFLFLLALLLFAIISKQRKFLLQQVGWIFLGAFLVLLPISIRNYAVSNQFVLTQTSGGMVFWVGNHAGASGVYDEPSFLTSAEPEQEETDYQNEASRLAGKKLTAAEASNFWTKQALTWIVSHPVDYVKLEWHKFLWLGNRTELPNNLSYYVVDEYSKFVASLPFGWGWLMTFAGAGILALIKEWRKWRWIGLFVLTVLLANLLFYTASEYRFPIVPWLILLAAVGFHYILSRVESEDSDKVMLGIMCLVPGFLWSHYDNRFLADMRSPFMDHFNWAQVSYRQGNQFDALEYYHKALAIDPFSYEAHYQLACLYYEMGFEDLSRQEFSRIGMSGPEEDPSTLVDTDKPDSTSKPDSIKVHLDPLQRESALKNLLREASDNDKPRVLLSLGALLQNRGDLVEARRYLVEAERLDTSRTEVLIRIAQIDLKAKAYDSALVRVERVLDGEADNIEANLLKYYLLRKLGKNTEADEFLGWLQTRAEKDAHWAEIMRAQLNKPLGFVPGPELQRITPPDTAKPNGNW